MNDQNQQGSYDPYGQQQQPQQPDPQWPSDTGTPGYDEAPHTQRWQGQTWETQAHPHTQAPAADTAYLPPQNYGAGPLPPEAPYPQQQYPQQGTDPYAAQYGEPQPAYSADQASAHPADQGTAYPYDERAADAYAYSAAPAEPAAQQHQQTYTPAPAEPAPVGGPAYGPATVVGNQRITDAQRARAEGRSPIIAPGIQPAGITAGIGLLLAGGAAIGPYALLVPLLVLQALTAAGWFRLNGMWPARQGIALAFAGALAADLVLLTTGREHAPAAIIGTLGVWVLLTLVLQLRSRADADDRMQGLMATVASAALAIIAAGFLGASSDAATVGALAAAAATLARALPLPSVASVVVALLAAAGAGIAAGGMTGLGSGGALLGFGAGVCALIGLRVASYDYPSRFVHMTAGVALPLAAAAPAVYLLGRAIG
ncbi:hypothetical protein G6045_06165 [Streptomyces sp. YC504]|uniref:Peptidase C83 domain-containing protein n=1 Tax=Streptomyces mesophilus TaxID=1775132 RepID=A0A6G4XDE9_9ACTN|nr:hypothetical protein [Streptomyces mesophilus]NGO75263.1 hypothetical protein [Streptomyces mesophilus]